MKSVITYDKEQKFLIADDDPNILTLCKGIFRRKDRDVRTTINGKCADIHKRA